MNKKSLPIFLAVVVVLGLIAYWLERPKSIGSTHGSSTMGSRFSEVLLHIKGEDISQIRVKKDYWSSFTLARGSDGHWNIVDPVTEVAEQAPANDLLEKLGNLNILSTLDIPGNDEARYREYGLWTPSLEVSLQSAQSEITLAFGNGTTDSNGVYCAQLGKDKVFVIARADLQQISRDFSNYRQANVSKTN